MKRELYIDGRLVDLSEDEPIAITYQVNDIAELANRQASFSNTFVVPYTQGNHYVLNFSNTVQTNTRAPYRKLPCTYIEGGIYKIQQGVAIIEEAGSSYKVTMYSGIFDFFQQIEGLTLKDIDWSEYNHPYTLASIKSVNQLYFSASGDICWPLIQWGAHKLNQSIDIRYQQPAIRKSAIIDKIFELANYTKSGSIFEEGIYKDMALTLSPDEYEVDDSFLNERTYRAGAIQAINDAAIPKQGGPTITNILHYLSDTSLGQDSDRVITDSVNPAMIPWPQGWAPLQTLSTTRYVSDTFMTVEINTILKFDTILLAGNENLRIFKNNRLVHIAQIGDYPSRAGNIANVEFEDSYTMDLKPGDQIKMQVYARDFYITNLSATENFLSITAINTIPLNSTLNYNYLIPELSLKDIIKSFCQMFGLIITNNGTELIFTKFREIKENIADSEDWSDKADLSEFPVISYRIGNYGQNNNAKYASDDITKGFGDSSFSIDDTVLPREATVFQLLYPSALPEENIITTTLKARRIPRPNYNLIDQYVPGTSYVISDQVAWRNIIYICIAPTSGQPCYILPGGPNAGQVYCPEQPDHAGSTYWQILSNQFLGNAPNQGVKIPRYTLYEADLWDSENEYSTSDEVNYGSQIWVALRDNLNVTPGTSVLDWELRNLQYEQTESSDSRLVLIRKINKSLGYYQPSQNITLTDGSGTLTATTSEYPLAYFSDADEYYNLTFEYLVDTYYKDYKNMLNQLKVVNIKMRLSDVDILKLNFLTLKYVKYFSNYFYLNKIEDHISGQSANVQLIRM